jgi:hypothetical protein
MRPDRDTLKTIRELLKDFEDVRETKRFFQPHNFYLNGQFCCGVEGKNLLIAIKPEEFDHIRTYPFVHTIDVGYGVMLKDVVWIPAKGKGAPPSLKEWVNIAVTASQSKKR